jgi:hypothetical protein
VRAREAADAKKWKSGLEISHLRFPCGRRACLPATRSSWLSRGEISTSAAECRGLRGQRGNDPSRTPISDLRSHGTIFRAQNEPEPSSHGARWKPPWDGARQRNENTNSVQGPVMRHLPGLHRRNMPPPGAAPESTLHAKEGGQIEG